MKIAVVCPFIINNEIREMLKQPGLVEKSRATGTVNLSIGLAGFENTEVHQLSLNDQITREYVVSYENVNVHFIPIPKKWSSFTFFQLPKYLIGKKLKELQPDIVHGHHTEIGSAFTAVNDYFPTVIGVHNNLSFLRQVIHQKIHNYSLLNFLETKTLHWAKYITVDSNFMKDLINPKTLANIIVIPNCINPEFFKCREEHQRSKIKSIVFLGKLRPEKGIKDLLDATKILIDQGKEFQLKIIGDYKTEYGEYIEKYAISLGVISAVSFKGWMEWEDAIKELCSSTALVVPSHHEPFGCSVAEGMALGMPVIASRTGGIVDSIQDKKTGILFEPGNSNDLAEKINYLLENIDHCGTIGNNAKEYSHKNFTPYIVAKKHIELYNRILDGL